ncbi:MAG TPA: class I SAM-dependent methyltransferase [Thermodesulfovibrionales bacterium]|nr:class I SAM-dependent methyltransferase [Thermodesulfovibrionales bacterium]
MKHDGYAVVPANLKKLEVVNRFFSGTGSSYDRVVTVCTCGFDRCWKKRLIEKIPAQPTCVMDQACGTGILTFEIARRFPDCRVTGVELRDEYLDRARLKARRWGMTNVDFILGRAEDVIVQGGCDCIISSYLAKYAELGKLITNAGKMLRPGGLIIMHDFIYPANPVFLPLWRAYFRILRGIGSRIFPEWQTVFNELPEFLRETRWVSESLSAMKENAFSDITIESLTFGTAAIVTARKPKSSPRRT